MAQWKGSTTALTSEAVKGERPREEAEEASSNWHGQVRLSSGFFGNDPTILTHTRIGTQGYLTPPPLPPPAPQSCT